ncbi:MAG: sterol desaturase family protein [Hyphomicrobiaceae bacterium]|nr:sterol desaturase family protein [Hyphomicrobiaceae bacterium]
MLQSLQSDTRFTGAFLFVAVTFIVLELAYARLAHHDETHDAGETLASLGVAVGNVLAKALTSGLSAVPFFFLYQHRLLDIPMQTAWAWVALFLGVEFLYYWFHLASHRVRWLWATHAVHHSATRFNLSAAVRLGWTGQLTGAFVFFLPLAWIGFPPVAIALMIGLGLLYQFFLHTSLDVSLGPLEWVLNTPRHHRVHHASNEACLDRNYGSILIVFDRLFGTFAQCPAHEPLRYGVKGREATNNPVVIALREWGYLARDVARARGIKQRLRVLFGPP